jgi:Zn ribbon nucleic-acid-binding protein
MDSMENQHQIETIYQCPQCNSQGEIMIDENRINIFEAERKAYRERFKLSVEHVKKLEEEIDMLRKQKIYLQSKLREKGNQDESKNINK